LSRAAVIAIRSTSGNDDNHGITVSIVSFIPEFFFYYERSTTGISVIGMCRTSGSVLTDDHIDFLSFYQVHIHNELCRLTAFIIA
jgi:hypothetical protein